MNLFQLLTQSFSTKSSKGLKAYLVRGAAGSLVLKVCNTGLSLIVGILLARFLGAVGYGHYAYAMALIQIISIPTVMGLPQLILRETSAYQLKNDYGRMRGLLIRANQFVLGVSLLLVIVAAGVAIVLRDCLDPTGLQTFFIALCLLPILGLVNLRMAALRGLRYVVLGLMPELLLHPMIFIIILLAGFYFFNGELSPQLVMIIQVAVTGLAFVIGALILMRMLPIEARQATAVYETKLLLKSVLPFMLLGAMQLVNSQTDIIMLGIFRPVAEVGIYRTAVQGAMLVTFALMAVNQVLAPVISGLYAEKDIKRLQRLITLSARAILIGTLPIAVILIIWGQWMLGFLFGPEFTTGATALRILCVGQLINAAAGSVAYILNMTGHEGYALRGVAVAAAINIMLNAFLIPPFGMTGAATATAVSLMLWNVLLVRWVYMKVGVLSIAFSFSTR